MADSNRVALRYDEETDWGVADSTPTMIDINFANESLVGTKETETSDTIRDDRQKQAVKQVAKGAGGDINVNIMYSQYDDFFLGLLGASAWSTLVEITSILISAANTDNSFNDAGVNYLHTASLAITNADTITRDAGSWVTDGVRVNMVVTAANSEDAGNDGDHIVTAVSALVLTIGAGGLTNNAADTAMDISNAGGFLTDAFAAYQWIEVRGFTGASTTANGYSKIASVVAAKIIVQGITLIDDAAGESVTMTMPSQIVQGVSEHSYTIEREYTDLTTMFESFLGQTVESMTLEIPVTGSITGAFTFLGKIDNETTVTTGDGSPTAALSNEELTSGNNVNSVMIDYAAVNLVTCSITISNNLRENRIVTAITPNDIGFGSISVTGSMEIYFTDHTEKTKFLDHTAGSFTIILEDAAGNVYIVEIPELQYTEDDTSPQGLDSDLTARITFEAERDDSEDVTIRIVRIAA